MWCVIMERLLWGFFIRRGSISGGIRSRGLRGFSGGFGVGGLPGLDSEFGVLGLGFVFIGYKRQLYRQGFGPAWGGGGLAGSEGGASYILYYPGFLYLCRCVYLI